MTARAATGTAWVCEDCYAAHAGILDEWEADGYVPDREPLALLSDAETVTDGMLWSGHVDPDECRESDECGCESVEFSRSTCHGCGSHLAGARHALTVWEAVVPA